MDKKADINQRLRKALGDSAVGTILDRENIDNVLREIVDYENALRQNIRRRPGSGRAFVLNRRAPGTTSAMFVGDTTTSFNLSDPNYTQVSFQYKTILTKGIMSRRLVRQGQSLGDIWSDEVDARARAMADFEDNALLTSTSSSIAFNGLQTLITNEVGMTTASGGSPLTLLKLDEAVDSANGPIDMMIMHRRTRRELFKLLLNQIDTVEVRGGFRLPAYAGIPIFVSTNMPITQTFTSGSWASNAGGNTSEILLINSAELFVSELTPMTMEDINTGTSQLDAFEIFEDMVPVLGNTLSCVRLTGISPAS